jgi:hypothetical protein
MARSRERESANKYWKQFFTLNGRGDDIWLLNASFPELAEIIPDLKSLTPADKLMKAVKDIAGGR